MFLIDRCKGTIKNRFVANGSGRNSDGKFPTANAKNPNGFGNNKGDKSTPRGFFVVGDEHPVGWSSMTKSQQNAAAIGKQKAWYPGRKMHGLQSYNSSTFDRGIVIHQGIAWKGKQAYLDGQRNHYINENAPGFNGRTYGCSGVSEQAWGEMMNERDGFAGSNEGSEVSGPLMYNFTKLEQAEGPNYCGEAMRYK